MSDEQDVAPTGRRASTFAQADLLTTTPSVPERVQLWSDDLPGLLSTHLEASSASAALFSGLTKLVFRTLFVYNDRASRREVTRFVQQHAKHHPQFVQAMLARTDEVLARYAAYHAPSFAPAYETLMSWVATTLAAAGASHLTAKTFSQGQKVMGTLLLRIAHADSDAPLQRSLSRASAVFSSSPDALERYLSAVSSATTPEAIALFGALVSHCGRRSDRLAHYRERLCKYLQSTVVGAPKKLPTRAYLGYRPLVASLTHDEYKTAILPAVDRALKRSADAAVSVLSMILAYVEIDLSAYSSPLVSTLMAPLKKYDAPLGVEAHAALAALARHCSDPGAVNAAADVILKALKGAIPQLAEKLGLIDALAPLAKAPLGAGIATVTPEVVPKIAKLIEVENNDEARTHLFRALSAFVLAHRGHIPDGLCDFFVRGFASKKEAARKAYLVHAQSLLAVPDNLVQLAPLAAPLVPIAAAGTPKTRPEALAALRILVAVASADTAVEKLLEDKGLWKTFLPADSYLHTSVQLNKATDDDLATQAALIADIATHFQGKFTAAAEPLVASLIFVMTHHATSASRAGCAAAARLHDVCPALAPHLLKSIHREAQQAYACRHADDPKRPAPRQLSDALLASIPWPAPPRALLPDIFVLAHHPYLTYHLKRPIDLWRRIAAIARGNSFDLAARLAAAAPAIAGVLVSDQGIYSDHPDLPIAAVRAAHTLAEICPDAVRADLFPRLESVLAEFSAPTRHELAVYYTPPDQVYAEENANLIPVVATPAAKSAPAASASAAGAKKKKQGTLTKEEQQQIKLAEQAEIRAVVEAQRQKVRAELDVLAAALRGAPMSFAADLPRLLAALRPLASSQLTSNDTVDALMALMACVEPALAALRTRLATEAHYLLAPQEALGPARRKRHFASATVSLNKLHEALLRRGKTAPFSVPACVAMSPFLVHIITDDKFPLESCNKALDLIAAHVPLAKHADYPCAETAHALIAVSERLPVVEAVAAKCLKTLAASVADPADDTPLLPGLLSPSAAVRRSILEALAVLPSLPSLGHRAACYLWVAEHDSDADNARQATELRAAVATKPAADAYLDELLPLLSSMSEYVRKTAAATIGAAAKAFAASIPDSLQRLFDSATNAQPYDGPDGKPVDVWFPRHGAALALNAVSEHLGSDNLTPVLDFLIAHGVGDPAAPVRASMIEALQGMVAHYGDSHTDVLFNVFQEHLDKPAKNERDDRVREGIVIAMGSLGKHLPKGDPRVVQTLDMMMDALLTPSEAVQKAVSKCLPPLVSSATAEAPRLVPMIFERLFGGHTYGDRRGAAYGLSGMVKGLGIASLKQYDVMSRLQIAIEDKDKPAGRQGALFAFECMCYTLGRLFEPYVVKILPLLLVSYGDNHSEVREATEMAAKAVMANLSGHGVKLVLPAVLKGLEERAWRSKQGSVEMLGAMSHCAPKQLSSCLPQVVPNLCQVLNDTHPKVRESADASLRQIASVIRNEEIQSISAALIAALSDPNAKTKDGLDALMNTSFVHRIDAPSLALIVPILHRGLRERSIDTKKKAALIVGNMCHLAEHKDLIPYLDLLVPQLKEALLDPIPEVRAIASKALGSLIRGMGEDQVSDLIPWLLATTREGASAVERSGAAQGLAEVVAAVGPERFLEILPETIRDASSASPKVREGALHCMVFFAATLEEHFEKELDRVLPCILHGLADEAEAVRDVAIRAGRSVVQHYGVSAIDLLLPVLQDGMFSGNWRIRQSSVQLLGDLLYKISGASGKIQLEGGSDDEGVGTESSYRAIVDTLGQERRNFVLAALYVVRSDSSAIVRQEAVHVWKSVVANTPRTLREILTGLMKMLIEYLASDSEERRGVAGRTLGELVKKLGDRVLPQVIPLLADGLDSSDAATRMGVCLGLSEVMGSVSKNHLLHYMDEFLGAVRKAICDELPDVREAAAQAFNTLQRSVGNRAVDEILPTLLASLAGPESGSALDGLRQILSLRGQAVMPYLVPKLTKPPITAAYASALGALAQASGGTTSHHLSAVLEGLLVARAGDDAQASDAASGAIAQAVQALTENGLIVMMDVLKDGFANDDVRIRRATCEMLREFCMSTQIDYSNYITTMLRPVLGLFNNTDAGLVEASWQAFETLCKARKEDMRVHLKFIGDVVKGLGPGPLPALCLPRALAPILPIFISALDEGSPELREITVRTCTILVERAGEEALLADLRDIMGRPVRYLMSNVTWQVKNEMLRLFCVMMDKVGANVKPFFSMMQSALVKAISDPSRVLRERAAVTLGKFVALTPRVDPIVTQLQKAILKADEGVRESMVTALANVLENAETVGAPALASVEPMLLKFLGEDLPSLQRVAARAMAAMCKATGGDGLPPILNVLLGQGGGKVTWVQRYGYGISVAGILSQFPFARFAAVETELVAYINALLAEDKVPLRQAGVECAGRLIAQTAVDAPALTAKMLPHLARLVQDSSNDVRRTAIDALKQFAKQRPDVAVEHLPMLVPPLMASVKAGAANLPVKLAAERALLHVLQIQSKPSVLTDYVATVDDKAARAINDYTKRVLSQLSPESDDEEDDE